MMTLKDAVARREAAQETGEFETAALMHRFIVAARKCEGLSGELHKFEARRDAVMAEFQTPEHGGAA